MMRKRPTFISGQEDMNLLRGSHGKGIVPSDARSAILYGNEDCPERFEWFRSENPHYLAKPSGAATLDDDSLEYIPD